MFSWDKEPVELDNVQWNFNIIQRELYYGKLSAAEILILDVDMLHLHSLLQYEMVQEDLRLSST
ncbi:hypothetical protein ACJIZ3_002521 [Penstemon smallii]|uniref:Uncharacterized protein n=1 Tax=Penstemon smallii TaxID=265156 RepID=A0ABD3UAD7_9LAMI